MKNIATSIAQCVRDWSGILCKRSDNGASKDRAESPTAIAGTPKIRQQSTDNSQQTLGMLF